MSARPGTPPKLREGETFLAEFVPDRRSYLRDHAWMAVLAMGAGMGILWAIGNPHVWTGAIGGLAAIALRGWYLRSEEMAVRWYLTSERLTGPGGREAALRDIVRLRSLGSAVQVVTRGGDKHLLKYQEDRDATLARLRQAGVREDA